MLGVEVYHLKKVKWYKQSLTALYSLESDYKQDYDTMYREHVKRDRKSIREHILFIKEIRKMQDEMITEEQEQAYQIWLSEQNNREG